MVQAIKYIGGRYTNIRNTQVDTQHTKPYQCNGEILEWFNTNIFEKCIVSLFRNNLFAIEPVRGRAPNSRRRYSCPARSCEEARSLWRASFSQNMDPMKCPKRGKNTIRMEMGQCGDKKRSSAHNGGAGKAQLQNWRKFGTTHVWSWIRGLFVLFWKRGCLRMWKAEAQLKMYRKRRQETKIGYIPDLKHIRLQPWVYQPPLSPPSGNGTGGWGTQRGGVVKIMWHRIKSN